MAALMSTVGVSEPPELLQALTRTAVSWASDESADERVLYQAFEVAVHHFAKSLTANQQDLISHLKQQRKLMKFDPATKAPNPYPSDARQYREFHGCVAWIYNPWTGLMRDPRDIGSDVQGELIGD